MKAFQSFVHDSETAFLEEVRQFRYSKLMSPVWPYQNKNISIEKERFVVSVLNRER